MAFTPTDPVLPDAEQATFENGEPIDNPYAPFLERTLTSFVATEVDSDEVDEYGHVFVTGETRMIQGVEATVVRDTAYDDEGRRLEDTLDWYAQDTDGNVWYLGEISYNFEYDEDTGDYLGSDIEGSWEWGLDGALPGLLRPAVSEVGDSYYQEYYPGEAEDAAQVLSLDKTVKLDFGRFKDVIKTFDFSTSDPEAREHKYAAPGIGVIFEEGLDEDDAVEEINQLVSVRTVAPSGYDDDADVTLADLKEGKSITPAEPAPDDLDPITAGGKATLTFLGGVDDLDNAVGIYQYDRATGEIGEGRIVFASSDHTKTGAEATVEVAKGQGLGVFVVSGAGESGVDLGDFMEGGLHFRNIAGEKTATIHDTLEPLATDADGNLLPLTLLHSADGAEDGINLLNAAGAVQATEIETEPETEPESGCNDEDDTDDAVVLGFEERLSSDPEFDADYNDVVVSVTADSLSEAALAEIASLFASEVWANGTRDGERLKGGDHEDLLFGRGGEDTMRGYDGDDRLRGGVSDDRIHGGKGDDLLAGGKGDDMIHGGRGHDIARFKGDADGYTVEQSGTGRWTVTDVDDTDGDYGTDMLKGIEACKFDDGLIVA